jgi:hypothetical protein
MLDQQPVALQSAEEFARFDDPAYQKLAMSWYLAGGDAANGYRSVMENRTHARRPSQLCPLLVADDQMGQ